MLKFENILNFHIETVISIDIADVFISNYVYQFFKAFGYKNDINYYQISARDPRENLNL